MKFHITNLYNFNKGDVLVEKQHQFAEAGRSLGFLEMGIFSYPVETDTNGELSRRLDGIIASLEPEDVVFIQLPTENGYEYEKRLLNKCKAYKNVRIVLILHETKMFAGKSLKDDENLYSSLYNMADVMITSSYSDFEKCRKNGLEKVLYYNDILPTELQTTSVSEGYYSLRKSDFYIKKILMDAIEEIFKLQNAMLFPSEDTSEGEYIHIGFGLHDKTGDYSVCVGTTMQSIIEHTRASIYFHILHDKTLNEQNRNRLIQVAEQSNHRISFHLLDEEMFSTVIDQVSYFTIGTMFRIMLPEILPNLKKIIYLDADILVNRDMKELWETDISNYYMAAVPDTWIQILRDPPIPVRRKEVEENRYINAGVLYINLERIRNKGNMREEVLEYLQQTKESRLPDQDAINALYNNGMLLLDNSWNYAVKLANYRNEKDLKEYVYHYIGTRCTLYSLTEIDYLYFETIGRTPWGKEECRKQLKMALGRTVERVEQFEKVLLQISHTDKKYIFYGLETYAMKNLYHLLNIKDSDYRVLENPEIEENAILPCKDLNYLLEEKEPFVIFVLPQADGWKSIGNLERLGFVKQKDFFVIPIILSADQGGYL